MDDASEVDSEARFARSLSEKDDEPSPFFGAFARCNMCSSVRKTPSIGHVKSEEVPQVRIEDISLEGCFERRGMRRWDMFWLSSFAELKGRTLTVNDVDTFEGARTMLAHCVLDDTFEVERLSEQEFSLRPAKGHYSEGDFQFHWRLPDVWCTDRWIENLQLACCPERPAVTGMGNVIPKEEAEETFSLDPMVISSMLSPGLFGFASLDPSSVQAMFYVWTQIADVIRGVVIQPDSVEQRQAKEGLERCPRPFKRSTEQFAACLLGDADVDLYTFTEAMEAFAGVLALMGSWTVPLAREGYKNCEMITNRLDKASGISSCRQLLLREHYEKIHGSGGMLEDPSGAVGVLWSYRGLKLWVEMWRRIAIPSAWPGPPPNPLLKSSFDDAYNIFFKQYHGFFVQSGVTLGTSLLPKWEELKHKFAPTQEELMVDVTEWCEVLDEVLPRIDAMICEFDMNDQRKTA